MANHRPPLTPEQLEAVRAVLAPMEREVLLLAARERLSNDEIAARLGITVGEAEHLLADALCVLDRAFDRQERPWRRFW